MTASKTTVELHPAYTVIRLDFPMLNGKPCSGFASAVSDDQLRNRPVLLDMSQIVYVNSIGIGYLVGFRRRVSKLGSSLIIFGLKSRVARTFKAAAVTPQVFCVLSDEAAALSAIEI